MTLNTVEDRQNIANIAICSLTTMNLVYYWYHQEHLNSSIPFIFLHFIIDLFFCKSDIKLHHAFGILIVLFKYYHNVSSADDATIVLSMYKTEISTFFYVINIYLNQLSYCPHYIKLANQSLFLTTFIKFRIYDYYVDIISNEAMYTTLVKYTNNDLFQNIFLYTGLYGLFALNLYWFIIMCKIMYKPIQKWFKESDTIILCHRIFSLVYFANLITSFCIYSSSKNASYLFDIIGIIQLSHTSHYYHNKIANYYEEHKQIEYISYELLPPFFTEQLAIHLRSFLCLATSVYYADEASMLFLLCFSAFNHLCSIINLVVYLFDLHLCTFKMPIIL